MMLVMMYLCPYHDLPFKKGTCCPHPLCSFSNPNDVKDEPGERVEPWLGPARS